MKRVVQGHFFRKSMNNESVSLSSVILHTLAHMVGFYGCSASTHTHTGCLWADTRCRDEEELEADIEMYPISEIFLQSMQLYFFLYTQLFIGILSSFPQSCSMLSSCSLQECTTAERQG